MPGTDVADDRIGFRSIWSIFRRRLGTFLTVLLAVLALGLFITLRTEPGYTASASVALKGTPEQIAPSAPGDRMPVSTLPSDAYVDTQVAVITSDEMARRVAAALGTADLPKLAVDQPRRGFLSRLLGTAPAAQPRQRTAAERMNAAVEYLKRMITVRRSGSTWALQIQVDSGDPKEAAQVANAYANAYANYDLSDQQAQGRRANELVAQRMEQLRAQALADTEAVQRYRIAHNLLSTTGATLTEQEISSYNQEVAQARAQAAEDQARLATARGQLRSGSQGDDVGEALGSGVVSSLRSQQSAAAAKVADLSAHYGPRYPDLVRARSELASINAQIKAEIDRVISNLAAKAQVSRERLGSLSGTLSGARAGLAANNGAMVGLKDLEQRADTSQALYQSYLNRYKDLSAREGTEQATAAVLTAAQVPSRPTSPNRLLNMALALALGCGLGLAAAFGRELAFSGVTTGDDVTRRLGVRYLGLIPTLSSVSKSGDKPTTTIVSEPRSAFAESFRSLRASIRFAAGPEAKVVAISSALPNEGKTATAICLARSMALSGDRTVLVDCDLRQKGVSRFVRGSQERPGLVEVLRNANTLDEALILDQQTGLYILPVAYALQEAELLTGAEMDELLVKLRNRFDWVVLDTAPVLPVADARLMLDKSDATVFAVRWRQTPDHAVRAAFRQLPRGRDSVSGVLLTRVDLKKLTRFGFGDESFYYDRYKSYYA
ncbi:GumC family protein [Sphingomonas aracearum]|nr:AAA family ATPase [Sphingomonas aracearum]